MEAFDPQKYVEDVIADISKKIGNEKALVAVSGGVDSCTCAVLVQKAIGKDLVCVLLDDAFMRQGEPEHVAETLSRPPLNVAIKIIDVRDRFLTAMKGLLDAEEKRKAFRETFYTVLNETAEKETCGVLVQGTIRADVIETVRGLKTQHNVLEQIGINPLQTFGLKVVEPLLPLLKGEVRAVARHIGLPNEFAERQPFPGPGLSIRTVGEIQLEKLDTIKKVTAIVEKELEKYRPGQYFAIILDNKEESQQALVLRVQETTARLLNVPSRNVQVKVYASRATGIEGGKRRYGNVIGIRVWTMDGEIHQAAMRKIMFLQERITAENPGVTRVFYAVRESDEQSPYVVGIRSIETTDFLTAKVSDIPWETLNSIGGNVIKECPNIAAAYYDVTPKPPATIEME